MKFKPTTTYAAVNLSEGLIDMAAFENFEEVWAALGRLHINITRLEEAQQRAVAQHAEQLAQTTERIDRLTSTVATLAGTVAQLATVAEAHERRLERLEGQ